jgi:DNA helicase II / ATP-dependent DNA helicase PcrA
MQLEFLEGLNEAQKKAVLHTEGSLLILAGAGSGKTRVITHRIAHLILNKNIFPYRICALTFTNKAAREMQERVIHLLPNSGHLVMIKTFHSLCLYILRRYPLVIGLQPGFTVYDTSLSESLLKEIIKDLGLDNKAFKPKNISSLIQSFKDKMQNPEDVFESLPKDSYYKSVAKIYSLYEEKKQERNSLDFGDLILKTVLLLKENPEIKEYYNQQWEYIMIDEYQDTNKCQYVLSSLLAGIKKNICVVGDDDQSIYSWRGADIRNILDFEKDYKNTLIVKLEENYRSTSNIIQAASSIIQNNQDRKDKTLFTNKGSGDPLILNSYPSEIDEARVILSKIKDLYRSEKTYSKIAIFYRTNAQSRFFEEALRSENIPYKIFGGFRFYDRAEIKDMMAYLTVLINPSDTGSLLRILNFPARGIGETSLEKLRLKAEEKNKTLYEILESGETDLRKASKQAIANFISTLNDLKNMIREQKNPSIIARSLVVQMGIEEELTKNGDPESTDRLENIQQFIESIQEYEESTESPSLSEYLNAISLFTSEEEGDGLTDYVTLMTVHNSKGLEFEIVFLTGMEEGTFPHFMSLDIPSGIEEERRLCYVAITRAKSSLFLSYSHYTRKFGEVQKRDPSRFLDEIPPTLLQNSKETSYRTPSYSPRSGNRSFTPNDSVPKSSVSAKSEPKVGESVRHKQYGVGKVLEVSGQGDNRKVKIRFGYTEKNFLLAYTSLEIVESG